MTFAANYPGVCDACGERFSKGAEIVWYGGAYMHAVCPPSAVELQRSACPTCFLELPVSGVCEECS